MKTLETWAAAIIVSAIIVVVCKVVQETSPRNEHNEVPLNTETSRTRTRSNAAIILTSPAFRWHQANIHHNHHY